MFPEMTGWLLAAKIFFVLFNLGVVAFIVYVWSSTVYLRRLFLWDLVVFFTFRAYNVKLIEKDWNKIKKRLLTQNPAQMKLAVIEADLLGDFGLTRDQVINFVKVFIQSATEFREFLTEGGRKKK